MVVKGTPPLVWVPAIDWVVGGIACDVEVPLGGIDDLVVWAISTDRCAGRMVADWETERC